MSGVRYNQGKYRLDLVPPSLSKYAAATLEFGASKYSDWNWRRGGSQLSFAQMLASLERHLLALKSGEYLDSESLLPHLSHIAANVAMLTQLIEDNNIVDDRYKGTVGCQPIERLDSLRERASGEPVVEPQTRTYSEYLGSACLKQGELSE